MRSQNSFSERIQRSKHSLKRHRKLVTCLAAFVVFAVTYSLVLPAVTLDEQKAEETPGIETQTKVEEQVEKAPTNEKQETQAIEKADAGSKGDASGDSGENAKAQAKSEGSDSSASKDYGSAVKSDKKDSGIEESDKDKSDKDAKESSEGENKLIKEKTELKFDGNGYKVVAEVDADAKLPADTKLKVKEIKDGDKNENDIEYVYDAYCDEALTAVRSQDGEDGDDLSRKVRLYDIKFVSDSSDKDKVEPAEPVKVTIEYDEAIEKSDKNDIRVVHFDDTDMDKDKAAEAMIDKDKLHEVKKVVLEAKSEKNDADSMKDVQFKSDRFSVYGIVYTVAKENEEQAATDEDMRVLTANGDTYTVTVSFGEDAKIPENAELRVKEIKEDDEEYKAVQEKAGDELSKKIKKQIPQHPVLFDIAIFDGDQEIEPAEGSSVKVEVKMAKDSVNGVFTDVDSPLLINDEPVDAEEQEMTQDLKVIHDVEEGELEVVDVDENSTKKNIVGEFETESFSNWLVFLDQDVDEITVGPGDTITLRPYSQWVWSGSNNVDGQTVYWNEPNTQGHANCQQKSYTDSQLDQTYSYYQITIPQNPNPGDFTISTNAGNTITVHVTRTAMQDPPRTVSGVDDITVNLFDYDLDKTLDVPENVASGMDVNYGQSPNGFTYDGINAGSALKFLGWGSQNGNNRINNYDATNPTTGIVNSKLDTNKYPKLNGNGNTNLKYLFSAGNNDVDAHIGVTGLFRKDDDGYYYFNSNTNYAVYDSATNSFKLYEHTYTQRTTRNNSSYPEENSKPMGFFPFHEYDSNNHLSPNHEKELNHHFGLSMEVKFSLPEGKVIQKEDGTTEPIKFEFSGDDDMWVFVDDDLSLDLGGIHQPITGSIDFTNNDNFVAGKEYTLRVFYLERGGCDSNCSIKFNMPLSEGTGDIRIAKEKKNGEGETGTTYLGGAVFGIWENENCEGTPLKTITSEAGTGLAVAENLSVRNPGQVNYYMKEITAPEGYIKSDKIYTLTSSAQKGTDGKYTFTLAEKDDQSAALETITQQPYNNATVIKNQENKPIEIDIVKVDKTDSNKKLSGAVFTLRQIKDEAPSNGTIATLDGTTPRDSQATAQDTGKTSFRSLTRGYYEITEKTAPAGYVITSDTAFYFKVENGSVTWLEKGTDKPSTWSSKTTDEMVSFTAGSPASEGHAATNASFTVKNEPGAALPAAGGPGTTWMYILGMLMVVGAGMTLAVRRRMRAY